MNNNIFFIIKFDKNLPNFKSLLPEIWNNILEPESILRKVLFFKFYSIQPNLNSYLVNNLTFNNNFYKYSKCLSNECMICNYSISEPFIMNKFDLPLNIASNSSCTSKECIYIISCIKCKVNYIGETSRSVKVSKN